MLLCDTSDVLTVKAGFFRVFGFKLTEQLICIKEYSLCRERRNSALTVSQLVCVIECTGVLEDEVIFLREIRTYRLHFHTEGCHIVRMKKVIITPVSPSYDSFKALFDSLLRMVSYHIRHIRVIFDCIGRIKDRPCNQKVSVYKLQFTCFHGQHPNSQQCISCVPCLPLFHAGEAALFP